MKTYELEGPIQHAGYVIPDVYYEKRRNAMLGYNDRWASFKHRLESGWLRIKHESVFGWFGGFVKRRLKRTKVIEK